MDRLIENDDLRSPQSSPVCIVRATPSLSYSSSPLVVPQTFLSLTATETPCIDAAWPTSLTSCNPQVETSPTGESFLYPTSDQSASNSEAHASGIDLPAEMTNASVPTIPSFATVAERFAAEFWKSATTARTATASPSTTPHGESPPAPFESVPPPYTTEDSGSKSTGDLIEHLEEASIASHPCSGDTADYPSAEGEAEAGDSEVEQMATEDEADEQLGQGLPLVPSDTAWSSSNTSCVLPTPESLALADQPTPAPEEVDAAWPAPSNDNADAADAWGTVITPVPNANYSDTWGTDSKPTAAANEANGVDADNGWSGGGGWKSDKARNDDQGYVKGGFRRDRPFWQPPESDGGWDGFRKRTGYVAPSISFFIKPIISIDSRAVVRTIKIPEASATMAAGSPRTTTRERTPIPPVVMLPSPRGAAPTTRRRTSRCGIHRQPRTSKRRGAWRLSLRSKSRGQKRRRHGPFLKWEMPGKRRPLQAME